MTGPGLFPSLGGWMDGTPTTHPLRELFDAASAADAPTSPRRMIVAASDTIISRLEAVQPLRERDHGLVELNDAPRVAKLRRPILLGAFEPVLMGWCSREPVLGEHDPRVVTGGVFRAFAFAPVAERPIGRAVATWKFSRSYRRSVGSTTCSATRSRATARNCCGSSAAEL